MSGDGVNRPGGHVNDIREIYAVLLSRQFAQTVLFRDLRDQKQEDRDVRATCPLCPRGGHHFSYNLDRPRWICYKSGERGDWIKYMELRTGISFRDALAYLADRAHAKLPSVDREAYDSYVRKADLLEEVQEIFRSALVSSEGEPVLRHLQDERGWSQDDVRRMELGVYFVQDDLRRELPKYAEEEIEATGLFTAEPWGRTPTWITVPWRDWAGRSIGFAGSPLLSDEERETLGLRSYHYAGVYHGFEKSLGFPGPSFIQACRGAGSVLLVQDPLTALCLNARGAEPTAISVGGTMLSGAQAKALEGVGIKTVHIALNRDQAGQKATLGLIEQLRRQTGLYPARGLMAGRLGGRRRAPDGRRHRCSE